MSTQLLSRVQRPAFHKHIMSAEESLKFFKNGHTLGLSGFTPAGYPKKIPIALANYVKQNKLEGKMKFNIFVGASVGAETLDKWAELEMIDHIYPYQTGKFINAGINNGKIIFKDIHLSNFANSLTYNHFKRPIDIAIIEASYITADGGIVPGAAGGVAQEVAKQAKQILVEVNTSIPSYLGMHDMVQDLSPPNRRPMLVSRVDDRMGEPVIRFDTDKIIGIVESTLADNGRPLEPPGETEIKIANHLFEFFREEVKAGRLPPSLGPLQSGVGSIANAVVAGFVKSEFKNLTVWTEVLQDTMLDLFDAGKLLLASTSALSFSIPGFSRFYANWDSYRPKIVIRPQAISNHPEIIRRLGVISMNTPVEIDIYGHANSTHLSGTKMLNGLGGSGDFLRNSFLPILHTPSTRKTKTDPTGISCIVPFCSHIDHTEHDVFIYVTEQGLADARGLAPYERARLIIEKCAHPDYKDQLFAYLDLATKRCLKEGAGHEPHLLESAFKMYQNLREKGTMKVSSW